MINHRMSLPTPGIEALQAGNGPPGDLEKERTRWGYWQWTFTEWKGTSGTMKASMAKLTSETL